MIIRIAMVIIIIIQALVNLYLSYEVERNDEHNQEYFDILRRDYDIKVEELKKDIELRDEIIEGLQAKEKLKYGA